jgi:exodeoxyribonuclease V gamma subunit
MIRLTYSNQTEELLDALVRRVHAERASGDPLAPIVIVAPNKNVERYVELGIAQRLGIAVNLRFERLSALVRRWLEKGERKLLIGIELRARVLRGLLDEELIAESAMDPVRRYLAGAGERREAMDLRRAQLAIHVAHLFEEYTVSRPELLTGWDAGRPSFDRTDHAATEAWQRALWRAIRTHASGASYTTLAEALDRAGDEPPARELHVFGLSYVARIFSRVYASLGERSALHLYALNPCEEFWEDVETRGELRRRRRSSDAEPEWAQDSDPFRLSTDTETPLLRLWGRPGREHIRLLDAITECDFEPRFVAPDAPAAAPAELLPLFSRLDAPPLLASLQKDILTRAPERRGEDAPTDASVQIFAAPSVRREVETVAAEIWRLMEAKDDLTFDRIAVLVNGPERDLYLPHIAAVFEEAHAIPYNVADLSLASASPIVDAALRLLALPSTRFTRPDVLSVIAHPRVRPADVEQHAWAALCDRLGIFFGVDREDHRGTYVGEDLFHFEQGLVRVALGAFMAGEASGDPSFVELGTGRYLPEESPPGEPSHARFALLVRSLASDARFAAGASLTLKQWAALFSAMLSCYLRADDEREEHALRRALAAIETLAEHDVSGTRVSYTIAHELAKEAIAELAAGSGQHLADGVAVSSLLPMRAIPFRVIFVLGLGEGRFPASDRRDSMDLRAARRHVGDVTPPERDRYTFLETLLCARERLYVSYVARDETTGDTVAPSVVIEELLEVVERGYLRGARGRLVRHPKLRRDEEPDIGEVLPEAAAEQHARSLGRRLREELPPDAAARLARADGLRRVVRRHEDERALGLLPLPERRSAPKTDVLRLSLASLRRFLECPLQAWTRTILRLDEDDLDSSAALSDEPLTPSALESAIVLRSSFIAHAIDREELEIAYYEAVRARKVRGRWPIGVLEEIAAGDHLDVLHRWSEGLSSLRPERAFRARFGSAVSHGESEEVHDPIVLSWEDDPRARGSGRSLRVELVGQTELLCDSPRASVVLIARNAAGERGRVTELRHAIRAFFDHAALSAAGRARDEHRAALLIGDRERPSVIGFGPIQPDAARAWLAGLVRDLVSRPHAYLLPCEAVLRLGGGFSSARGEDIVRSVELVRDRWGGGQSRYGPVRDALAYAPPAPGDAEEIVERRFGAFFRSLGEARP